MTLRFRPAHRLPVRSRNGLHLGAIAYVAGCCLVAASAASAAPAPWSFTEVAASVGLAYTHSDATPAFLESRHMAGGAAVGDIDGDGWLDVYAVGGSAGANLLFHNRGDGRFEEIGAAAGVALSGVVSSGPVFGDVDGDGHLDLFVGGVDGTPPTLFRNRGDGTFEDRTFAAGLAFTRPTFSAAFGDYDLDGDLDLATSHWGSPLGAGAIEHLWRNAGDGTFTDVSLAAGLVLESSPAIPGYVFTFTPRFADLDGDGFPELLYASDFHVSQVFHNEGNGTFTDMTTAVISDENGMGSAVGDVDNDGDLDWFVSSIWDPTNITDPHVGKTGNRFYRNGGDGTFTDDTDTLGVRAGSWGWGSTFADLNGDGLLDLFHVNGFGTLAHHGPTWEPFIHDAARLFVARGDGSYAELATALGVADTGLGRGVAAFDFDRDGDLDLLATNNDGPARLFRNEISPRSAGFATIRLRDRAPNSEGIGALVRLTASGITQLRDIHAGSNYVSADPAEAHFGLGENDVADEIRVSWPGGDETILPNVPAGAILQLSHLQPGAPTCTAPGAGAACSPGGRASSRSECVLEWRTQPAAATDRSGFPGGRMVCQEGDPACDLDPNVANRSCRFRVSLCINTHDPRLPACSPGAVAGLSVRAPGAAQRAPAVVAQRQALLSIIGRGPGGLGFVDGSPFADATPDHCSAFTEVEVPLRERVNGELRSGVARLAVQARGQGKKARSDADTLQLECLPPV